MNEEVNDGQQHKIDVVEEQEVVVVEEAKEQVFEVSTPLEFSQQNDE